MQRSDLFGDAYADIPSPGEGGHYVPRVSRPSEALRSSEISAGRGNTLYPVAAFGKHETGILNLILRPSSTTAIQVRLRNSYSQAVA
jgi:hypothetical protein